uniref:Uncharacterized protein n=1 Tax=Anguilla anguilla TaxID=7936 RepID=A0A0E9WWH9_ANGAN
MLISGTQTYWFDKTHKMPSIQVWFGFSHISRVFYQMPLKLCKRVPCIIPSVETHLEPPHIAETRESIGR